ncbi:MAG: glycosyltransferase, partial [Candidatus Aenigmarchaeota archaeon]|nr:glycosyltransferase [Candidatus Aenigmarchaeota archaeon]
MHVSVILPTKDEPVEEVSRLIKKIHTVLGKTNHEVIVVDKSKPPLKLKNVNALVVLQRTNGLGNAIKEGFEFSRGDVIVVMDADGSHRPEDIPKLLKKIREGYDLVVGSRYIKGGKAEFPLHRKIVSIIFNALSRLLLGIRTRDNMSGFIAIRRKVFEKLSPHPIGFKINLELIYKAEKRGYKLCEVPIV